ncbi:MAG TPA: helix-turn-helix transcriptional regulator [Candidatus Acidoferrum sp.]|nr:helix-turn-helix transcriptional regulator [Candidatus Acidoferrum sp.]
MDDEANRLAEVSAHLAVPARAAMVLKLMDGSTRATGELMMAGNVSSSSASTHLAKLVSAHLLKVTKEGRHKYYRIATAAVAHAVEALETIASSNTAFQVAVRSRWNPFAFARTCYDHLAGKLGVQVAIALQKEGQLRVTGKNYEVTEQGANWLIDVGINCRELLADRRMFAPQCLDFTERHHHIAGALGAALLRRMIEVDWIRRTPVPRAVRVTAIGRTELTRRLRLVFTAGQDVLYRSN